MYEVHRSALSLRHPYPILDAQHSRAHQQRREDDEENRERPHAALQYSGKRRSRNAIPSKQDEVSAPFPSTAQQNTAKRSKTQQNAAQPSAAQPKRE